MGLGKDAARLRVLRNVFLGSAAGVAVALTAGAAFAATQTPTGGGTITYNNGGTNYTEFGGNDAIRIGGVGAAGDTITITGLTRNNTVGSLSEALNIGSADSITGGYTVILRGNNLTAIAPNGLDALIATLGGGDLTVNTTGGAANIFNRGGLVVSAGTGNAILNVGADTFNTVSGSNGITATTSAGNITLDSLANITVAGTGTGIQASVNGGSGVITLGGSNGGIKGTITATNGTGIYALGRAGTSNSIITGAGGVINAKNGITVESGNYTVDIGGSLTGSTAAFQEVAGSPGNVTLILRSTSTISGPVSFANNAGADILKIVAGANISNATFAFGTGGDTIQLDGAAGATGTFDVTKGTGYESLSVVGGVWTLQNTAAYTGGTVVANGGTLAVNNNITTSSGVNVLAGGTLKGTGTLPTTTVAGTLAPGNSIGTINVAGNLTFSAGSTYQVETSPTTADKTVATGTATISSTATVNAVDTGGVYSNGTRLTILTANGGITGTFGSLTLTGSYTGARPSLSYDAKNVYLDFVSLKLVPLLPANYTRNQLAVASAIDTNATLPAAFAALSALSGAPLAAAMDELSGEISTQAPQAAFALTNNFLATLTDPFATQRSGLTDPVNQGAMHLWGNAWGLDNQLSGKLPYGSHDASNQGYGVTLGLDYDVSAQTVIGAAIGVGRSTFQINPANRGSNNNLQLGFNIKYSDEEYYLAGALNYSNNAFKTDRNITTGGAATLHSSFSGDGFGGRAEAGFLAPWSLPFNLYAAVQAQNVRTPAYNEAVTAGTTSFALTVHNNSINSVRTEIGAWFNQPVNDNIVLTGRAAWAHDSFDYINTTATFQNLTKTGFNIIGAYVPRNSGLVSGGAKIGLGDGLSLSINATGQIAENYTGVSGGLTLDKAF